ncbi:hypothetical protein SFR_6843 [Streptomyces sp. FR-008]|nr:hypothetical protein SFR_6843 [Streptomyces sp. FR-008]
MVPEDDSPASAVPACDIGLTSLPGAPGRTPRARRPLLHEHRLPTPGLPRKRRQRQMCLGAFGTPATFVLAENASRKRVMRGCGP